jgi:hypothetical protein
MWLGDAKSGERNFLSSYREANTAQTKEKLSSVMQNGCPSVAHFVYDYANKTVY